MSGDLEHLRQEAETLRRKMRVGYTTCIHFDVFVINSAYLMKIVHCV